MESTKNIIPPTSKKVVIKLIVLVNYYRDLLSKHSPALQPLTSLTSIKVRFEWTYVEQK